MLRLLGSMAMNTNTRGAMKFHYFLWSESKKICTYASKWKMGRPLNLCFVDRAQGHQDISLLFQERWLLTAFLLKLFIVPFGIPSGLEFTAQLWNVKNSITPVANHAVVVRFPADDTLLQVLPTLWTDWVLSQAAVDRWGAHDQAHWTLQIKAQSRYFFFQTLRQLISLTSLAFLVRLLRFIVLVTADNYNILGNIPSLI